MGCGRVEPLVPRLAKRCPRKGKGERGGRRIGGEGVRGEVVGAKN